MTADETIQLYLPMLEIPKEKFVTPHDAEWRASQFLMACAKMAEFRSAYTNSMIAAESLELIAWNDALKVSDGETITAKKINAQANKKYRDACEVVKTFQVDIDKFKQLYEVFNNAHIFFRQLSTQIHKESRNGL